MITFQEIIARLQAYWGERGCLVWYPYHETVGAGTANPATTLRVLGPEPWNVAYLEPSFRPDDGRYGDNPNRLQMHHQFQVILKPVPYNPQDLYLESLYALGIDREKNDLRFVEDNWESPALGAWGLGWEVWLNGLEISQYTYFQQAGGKSLDPPALELTYGLERIALALCNVASVWEIPWNDTLTYGDILHRAEVEHCIYDFELADVERLRQTFDTAVAEAESCLERGLVVPAHDQVLRCSHTFNLLDSRAAVGVTERAAFFARMRGLSRKVAEAYLAQREEAEHPMLAHMPAGEAGTVTEMPAAGATARSLLLEIGCEELPADDVDTALAYLGTAVGKGLDEARLAHGEVRVTGTPRRLVIEVADVAAGQEDKVETVKGPPISVARDGDGNWTKAAIGFGKKLGIEPEAFATTTIKGSEYLMAERTTLGRPAVEVLAELLPAWIGSIPVKKTMRWLATARDGKDAAAFAFSRPVRWIVALLGEDIVPFKLASLASGRLTYGLRAEGSPEFSIPSADAYAASIAPAGIIVDPVERAAAIRSGVESLAKEAGGVVDPEDFEAILTEVLQMVEKPTPFLGKFDADHLDVPAPVLVTVMKKHQRYFPVRDGDGKLLPCFIGVRNGGTEHLDNVAAGNEAVVRARFADARYFFDQDRKQSLESWLPRLGTLTFQEKLGSFLDKTERIEKLAPALAALAGKCTSAADRKTLARAARLAKADMVTRIVTEFPYLAGTMGAAYAGHDGEDAAVVEAIRDHYLPQPGKPAVPSSDAGLILAIADRVDKLAGLFGIGLRPSGTADPYALRRDALGLLVALLESGTEISIRAAIAEAAALMPVTVDAEAVEETAQFVERRFSVLLGDRFDRPDLISAAIAASGDNPVRCVKALETLVSRADDDAWQDLLVAYARCARLGRSEKAAATDLDRGHLSEASEIALVEQFEKAAKSRDSAADPDAAFDTVTELVPSIHAFFENVMVMDENPDVRRSRLGLLASIDGVLSDWVDLSRVEGF